MEPLLQEQESTQASTQFADDGKEGPAAAVAQKIVVIHADKQPTIKLDDFVSPTVLFNSLKYGPTFGCYKQEPGLKLRHTKMHSFVETIMLAYVHHLPLTLSPDDVWTCIVQGFGLHMEQHAEKLRKKFVDFQGKKELHI